MMQLFVAVGAAFVVAFALTPVLIRKFSAEGLGQEIREDGPQHHAVKRGTPTMGGIAIIAALWVGYLLAHLVGVVTTGSGPSVSGVLVMLLGTAMGTVGFLDDYIKLAKQRNLGLNKRAKLLGQTAAGLLFAVLIVRFPNEQGLTPGSMKVSLFRDFTVMDFSLLGSLLGGLAFVLFILLVIAAWSNAVNLTDGLDGLAAGTTALVMGSYVAITFWQFRNSCSAAATTGCYDVRDPLDLALIAAATLGACVGFLWWNAAPAKIFMGDTGSLALGGLVAGLSITSRTELLMVIIGALFVAEAASVVLQVGSFKLTGKRIFRMAPLHHHFEIAGWAETQVIIRFWLLAAFAALLGTGLFYADWLTAAQ